jgi:hypothetical protein
MSELPKSESEYKKSREEAHFSPLAPPIGCAFSISAALFATDLFRNSIHASV